MIIIKAKAPEISIGDIFDDLKVIKTTEPLRKYDSKRYIAECLICHRKKEIYRSCLIDHRGTTHKACGKGIKTKNKKFHSIWQGIRQRTTNPNTEHWECYGGRGIKSEAFKFFIDFYDSMYEKYKKAIEKYGDEKILSIDRIDVNKDYTPENCRWISLAEQKGNMRKSRWFKAISPLGETFESKNQCEFARIHNLEDKQINACLTGRFKTHKGWKFSYIEKCNDYPNS